MLKYKACRGCGLSGHGWYLKCDITGAFGKGYMQEITRSDFEEEVTLSKPVIFRYPVSASYSRSMASSSISILMEMAKSEKILKSVMYPKSWITL
jgi:hypothetical protein